MNYLENFQKIGYWELDDKYKSNKSLEKESLKGINFIIDEKLSTVKDVIYLFKTGTEILYIGETSSGLKNRFLSYRYGFDKYEDTDNRVKIAITSRLVNGDKIEIYYWKPVTNFEFLGNDIEIPLSKPIEELLIKEVSKHHDLINNKGVLNNLLTIEEIEKIFSQLPENWGYRGHPLMWKDLKNELLCKINKIQKINFKSELINTFSYLIVNKGKVVNNDQRNLIYISEYDEGGLSGGVVDTSWWHEIGFTKLLKNYTDL